MKNYFVISAVGRDRPGFVNHVAIRIGAVGGNIELQRSIRMAGEYAALFLISVADGGVDRGEIEARLAEEADEGLSLGVRDAMAGEEHRPPGARVLELIASGADQPGIIDAVTQVLFKGQVNLEAMDYDTESAPMTGDTLFRMNAIVAAPADIDLAAVRAELRALEAELNVDILMHPVA